MFVEAASRLVGDETVSGCTLLCWSWPYVDSEGMTKSCVVLLMTLLAAELGCALRYFMACQAIKAQTSTLYNGESFFRACD